MRLKQLKSCITLAGLMLGAGAAPAAAAPLLTVGDPAPTFQPGAWIQGGPVKAFSSDTVYLVDFWASWFGPCRISIPHLNELQRKFQDKKLVVIGQDCLEKDENKVAPFVQQMGQRMSYRVALDNKETDKQGRMWTTWMAAAGQEGVPTTFVIDKQGKIAWIGHPQALNDQTIEQVLAGTFDVRKAAAAFELRRANAPKLREASERVDRFMKAKEWEQANAALDEIEKLLPEEDHFGVNRGRLQIALNRGDDDGAARLAEKMSSAQPDDAPTQNALAWQMASQEGLQGSALDAAVRIADRAFKASGGKDPEILDTIARVSFMHGDKDKAIELQTKAVALAGPEIKAPLQATLDSYKQGKLPKLQ